MEVLTGDHKETAFVEIKTDINCLKENEAPLIRSSSDSSGVQVFISHSDAVALARISLAKYFTTQVSKEEENKGKTEMMFNRMDHLGCAFLELTGSYVAKYEPFYSVKLV